MGFDTVAFGALICTYSTLVNSLLLFHLYSIASGIFDTSIISSALVFQMDRSGNCYPTFVNCLALPSVH